jgi:ubiquinone/menaquinone biosynthesis C-methylase UbiE
MTAEIGEIEKQLADQRDRWNSRAATWDSDLLKPDHYANFENGYQRFLDFEKKELSGIKGEVGIDLGCGTGIASVLLAEKVKKIYLLDIAQQMLDEAQKKVPQGILLNKQVTEIPLPKRSVDIAVSRGILVSHLPAPLVPQFFNELGRIMRVGGKVIFDFLCNEGTVNFAVKSPKNTFTLEQMTRELKNTGFCWTKFDGTNDNRVVRVSAIKGLDSSIFS